MALLKKKKLVDVVFGDIGCNGLLYFMNAMDTGLAMGASEGQRIGYVMDLPEKASRCITVWETAPNVIPAWPEPKCCLPQCARCEGYSG
jgi:hypothetical protein